jgi:hypothetical protein
MALLTHISGRRFVFQFVNSVFARSGTNVYIIFVFSNANKFTGSVHNKVLECG